MNGDDSTLETGSAPAEPTQAPTDSPPPQHVPAQRPVRRPSRPREEELPEVGSLHAQVYAQNQALQVMFERLDQSVKLQDQDHMQLQALMVQMNDTLRLWQESFKQLDQMMDKLAWATAATIKMYQLQLEQVESQQGLLG